MGDFDGDIFAFNFSDDEDSGSFDGNDTDDLFLPGMYMNPILPLEPRHPFTGVPVDIPGNSDGASRHLAFVDRFCMREQYKTVPPIVSSADMFNGNSWAKMKFMYEKNSSKSRRFDYEAYRRENDNCCYYVIDTQRHLNTKAFGATRAFQHQGLRDAVIPTHGYTKRRDNVDHHMIPLVCCDKYRRSMMWLPLDVSVRSNFPRSHPARGQPVFADYMEEDDYKVADHVITQYSNFIHGVRSRFAYPPLRGYYPLDSDLAACANSLDAVRMWEAREPLTVVDGFDIMKKLASTDPDSWTNVMAFLPFNEKCNWSQYLSSDTAESVYGVAYPSKRLVITPNPKWDCTRFMFTSRMMGGLQACSRTFGSPLTQQQFNANRAVSALLQSWLTGNEEEGHSFNRRIYKEAKERKIETETLRNMLKSNRQAKPFFHLWHLKTIYDLSNFCNRHAVRVEAMQTISHNIKDQLVKHISDRCVRLSNLGATKFVDDGSVAQAQLLARHATEHYTYMQSWRDMSQLVALTMHEDEPTYDETATCFSLWQKHASYCRKHNLQPEFKAPMLHAQWAVNRLHAFADIAHRNMGKSFNGFLSLLYDQDCCVGADVNFESSPAHTTVLDLVSMQMSNCMDADMQRIYSHCVRFNYQEMACPVLPIGNHGGHTCGNVEACVGCDCHHLAKTQTAVAVRTMFGHLEEYQERFGLNFRSAFIDGTYTSSRVQLQNHVSRKRVHTSITPSPTPFKNVDMNTIEGLEPLLTGVYNSCAAPPMYFDSIRRDPYC